MGLSPSLVLIMSADLSPKKFAVDLMTEVAKQLITLASGAIVLSVSFLDLIKGDTARVPEYFSLVIASWITLLLSILSGLLALGALATSAHLHGRFDIDNPTARFCLGLQQVLFVAAFAVFVWFAIENHGT